MSQTREVPLHPYSGVNESASRVNQFGSWLEGRFRPQSNLSKPRDMVSYLPTAIAFHYCGDALVQALARRSVRAVAHVFRNLFREEKPNLEPVYIEKQVREPYDDIDEKTIRLGLYLAPDLRLLQGTWGNADKLLTKRKNEALQGKKLPETLRQRVVPLAEIVDDALSYSRKHKRSYRDDESRGKRLKEWFGTREAESLTGQEMEKQLADVAAAENWACSTYNHYRSLLMVVYREARRAGKVSANPARDIRHRKESNNRLRFLSRGTKGEDNEYERL